MWTKRNRGLLGLLLAVWALFCVWQGMEHSRVKATSHVALEGRARDISNSVAVVIRSQSRFGLIRYRNLQDILNELLKVRELQAVVLLNAEGEVIASAGTPLAANMSDQEGEPTHWERDFAVFTTPIDLGVANEDGITSRPATIVLPLETPETAPVNPGPPGSPPPPPPRRDRGFGREARETSATAASAGDGATSGTRRGGDRGRRPFGRPPWMTEDRYRELLTERGLHGFKVQMSTASYRTDSSRDLGLRLSLAAIALLATLGFGVAWTNMQRTGALQIRLLRASEMNRHLKEMNVAAAGLAHETRNPLNIVRGLAQMVSKSPGASDEVRQRSSEIVEEVDRVTGRLNEFINYSRPPEPRPARTSLRSVALEVERALGSDMADKGIEPTIVGEDVIVQADESLLRQVLFKLLVNAVEAVPHGGRIEIRFETAPGNEAAFEVRDSGPGVSVGQEREIFQPYFTTRKGGTGLGLAVVRQIVLAHQWEVEYIRDESGVSRFRVSGMRIA
jgi:signal transduction histidine kinase